MVTSRTVLKRFLINFMAEKISSTIFKACSISTFQNSKHSDDISRSIWNSGYFTRFFHHAFLLLFLSQPHLHLNSLPWQKNTCIENMKKKLQKSAVKKKKKLWEVLWKKSIQSFERNSLKSGERRVFLFYIFSKCKRFYVGGCKKKRLPIKCFGSEVLCFAMYLTWPFCTLVNGSH